MTDPKIPQNGPTSKVIGGTSDEILDLLDSDKKVNYLQNRIQKLIVEKQNYENQLLKEVSKAPADKKKDALITGLKEDLEKNKALNENLEIKLSKALDTVEDQLNIKKDNKTYTLYDRILRLGSSGFSILESLKLQIVDCLTTDINNFDYIQDTLYNINSSLGDPDESIESDSKLDNIETKMVEVQQVAFGLNHTDLQVRKSLQTSIGVQHDLFSLIKLLRTRINKLKQQVNFLKEHRESMDDREISQDNAIGDYSGGSFVSAAFQSSAPSVSSYRPSIPERNKLYYKKHNSVETNQGEEIDPHALSISIRAEIEHEYNEKTFKMQQELAEAQTKAILAEKEKESISLKLEKSKSEYEALVTKFKKLSAQNKENQAKSDDLDKKLTVAKKQIAKLTGKPVTEIVDEEQEKIKKLSANLVELKKRYEKSKEDLTKSNEELNTNKQKVSQLEEDKKKLTEDLQSQIDELKTKLANSTAENEKLQKYINAYKKKTNESKNSIETLKTQLSKATNDAALQLKESNEKLETHFSDSKKAEEKLKLQNKKLLDSLNNLRSALGLNEISSENSDDQKEDVNEEAVKKVNQIIDQSKKSSNQLISIRKALGIPENENENDLSSDEKGGENSIQQQIQQKIESMQKQNEKLKEQKRLMRMNLGLNEEEEDNNDNNKPKSTVANELQKMKEENEKMKDSLKKIYKKIGKSENDENDLNPNDLCDSIQLKLNDIMDTQDKLEEIIGSSSESKDEKDTRRKPSLIEGIQQFKQIQAKILDINSKEKFVNTEQNDDNDESKTCLEVVDKLYSQYKAQESFTNQLNSIINPNGDKNDPNQPPLTPEEKMNELVNEIDTLKKGKEQLKNQLDTIRTQLHIPQNENNENGENNEDIASNIISLMKANEELKAKEDKILQEFGDPENNNENIIETLHNNKNENELMKRTINNIYETTNKTLNKESTPESSSTIDELCNQTEENMKDILKRNERLVEERITLLEKLGLPTDDLFNNKENEDHMSSTHSSVEDIIEQHQKMKCNEERMKANHKTLENLLGLNNDDSNSNQENDNENQANIENKIKSILDENDVLQTQLQTIRQKLEEIQTSELNKEPNPNKPDPHSHLNIDEIKENGEIIEKYVQTLGDEFLKAKNKGEQLQKEMEELKSTFNLNEDEEAGQDGAKSKENSLMSKLANTLQEGDQNKALLSTIKTKIGLTDQADEDGLLNKLNEYKNIQDRILEINSKEEFVKESEKTDDSKYFTDIIDKFYDKYKENESFTNKINSIMNPNGDENDPNQPPLTPEERMNELAKEIETLRKDKEQLDTIREQLHIPQNEKNENGENNEDIASNIISLIKANEELRQEFGDPENNNENIIETLHNNKNENELMKRTINNIYETTNKTLNKESTPESSSTIDELCQATEENMKDILKRNERLVEERITLLEKLGLPTDDLFNNKENEDHMSSTHSSVEDIIEQHQKMKCNEERMKANHKTLENLLGLNNSEEDETNDNQNEESIDHQAKIENKIKTILDENDALQTQVQSIRQQLEDIQKDEPNKPQEEETKDQQKHHLNLSEIKDNGEIIEKQIQNLGNEKEQLKQEVSELKLSNEKIQKRNNKLKEQKKVMRMHLGLNEGEEEDNDYADSASSFASELRSLKQEKEEMKDIMGSSSESKEISSARRKPSLIEGIQQFKQIQTRILDINSKEGFVNTEQNDDNDESKTCLEVVNKLYSQYKAQESFTNQLNSIINPNGDKNDPNQPPLTPEEKMNELAKEIETLRKDKEQLDTIREQLHIPQNEKNENGENNEDIASNIISLIKSNEELRQEFGDPENNNENIIETLHNNKNENELMKRTINNIYETTNRTLNKESTPESSSTIDELCNQTEENMKDILKRNERLVEERITLLEKLGLPTDDLFNNKENEDHMSSTHSSVEDIIEQHQKMKCNEERMKANHKTLENLLGLNNSDEDETNDNQNEESIDHQAKIENKIKTILDENNAFQSQFQSIRQQLEDIQTNELNPEPNSTTKRSRRRIQQPQQQKHLNLDEINDNAEIIERHIETLADEYSKVKDDKENLQRKMKELKSKFSIEDDIDESNESTDAIINKHKDTEEENKLMKKTLENIFRKTSKSQQQSSSPDQNKEELPLTTSDLCDNVIENITRIIEDAGTLNECQQILKGNSNENDGIKQTLSNLQKRSNEFDQLQNTINEQNDEISDLKSKLIEKDSKIDGILEERSAYQDLLIEVKDSIDKPKSGNQADSPLFEKLLTLSEEVSNYHKLSDKMNSLLDERSRSIAFLETEGFISPTSSTEERDKINVPNQIKYLIDQYKDMKKESDKGKKEKQTLLSLIKGEKSSLDDDDILEISGNSDIIQAFKKIKDNEKTLELQSSQLNEEIVQLKESLDQIKNSVGLQNSDDNLEEFDINQIIKEISHKAQIATKLNEFIEFTDHEESAKELFNDDEQPIQEYKPPEGKSKALQMIEKLEAFNVKYDQMCKENEDFKNEVAKIKEILGFPADDDIPLSSITDKIKSLKESSTYEIDDNENGTVVTKKKPIDQLNEIENLLNGQLPIQIGENNEESNETTTDSNTNMTGKLKEIIYQETKFEDQLNKIIDTTMNSQSEQKKDAKTMLKENKLDEISEKVNQINNENLSLKGLNHPFKSNGDNLSDTENVDEFNHPTDKSVKNKGNQKIFINDPTSYNELQNILESLSKFPDIEHAQESPTSELIINDSSLREINEKINEICQNYKKIKEENAQLLEDKMKSENEQSSLISQILGDDASIINENDENGEKINVNEIIKEKVKALQSSQKEISQYQEAISNLQNEKTENEEQIDKLNNKINKLLDRLENSQSNIRLQESDFTSLDFFDIEQGNNKNDNENNDKIFNYSNASDSNNNSNKRNNLKIVDDEIEKEKDKQISEKENKLIKNTENDEENENKLDDKSNSKKNKKSPTHKEDQSDDLINPIIEEEEEEVDKISNKNPIERGKGIHSNNKADLNQKQSKSPEETENKNKTLKQKDENSFENGNDTEIKFENDDENETEIKFDSDNEIHHEKSNKNAAKSKKDIENIEKSNQDSDDNNNNENKENKQDEKEKDKEIEVNKGPKTTHSNELNDENESNMKEQQQQEEKTLSNKKDNEVLNKNIEQPKIENQTPDSTENTKKIAFDNEQITNKSFKDKITDLEQRCNELEGHVDKLKTKNRKLTKEKNQLCKVLNIDINDENDDADNQQDKSSKRSPLVMSVKEMKENIQAKNIENEKLNDLVNEQKSKIQEIEESNREIAQQLKDAKKSIKSMMIEKQSIADVLGVELENGQESDSSLCSLVKELKKNLSESNKEAEQLKSNISEFQGILQPNSGKKKSKNGSENNEVLSVNDVLGKLKKQLNDLTQSNTEKDEIIKDLQESISQKDEEQSKQTTKLNKQNAQLKKQLEDLQESVSQKEEEQSKQTSKLNKQNAQLKKQLEDQNEQNEENEKELSKLTDKNAKLKKQIKDQNDLNENKIVKLNRENQKLKEKTDQLNQTQKDLQNKFDDIQQENEKIKSEVKSAIDALQKKEKLDDYSNSPLLTETQAAISLIRNQKEKIEKLNQERKSILEAVYGESYVEQNGSGLLDELDLLGNQMNEQSVKMNNSINEDKDEIQVSPTRSPISPRQRSVPRTSNSILDAMNEIKEKLNKETELNAAKDEQIEELNQKIKELEEKQKQLINDDNDDNDEIDYQNESKDSLIDKLKDMKKKLKKAQKENKKLKGENYNEEDENEETDLNSSKILLSFSSNEIILDKELKTPSSNTDKEQKKKVDPKALLQEHLMISKLFSEEDKEISEDEISQFPLALRVKELQNKEKSFRNVLNSLSSLFGHVDEDESDDYSHLSARIQEIHAINSALQSEIAKLKEKLKKSSQNQNNLNAGFIEEEEEETKEENSQIEMSEIIDLLHIEGNTRMDDIKETITQLQKYENELREIQEILDQEQNNGTKNDEEIAARVKQLVQTNQELKVKIESLYEKLSDFAKIKEEKNQYSRQIKHIENEMCEKDDNISQIQQMLNIKQSKNDARRKKELISSLEKENKKLKQKNDENEQIISKLQKEIDKLNQERKLIFDSFEDDENENKEGNQIQNKIDGMKEKLRTMQEKCKNLEKEIEEYKNQIKQKESENDSLLNKINKLNEKNKSLSQQLSKYEQYSDDYDDDNNDIKPTKSRSTKSTNVNQLESQIKNLNEEMKKKDNELAQIKQSLSPFINSDSDEETNENNVISNLKKISDENQKMKKDVKAFEKERRDIGKLFEITNPPTPSIKKNSSENDNQQKSFPIMIKDKVNDLIKQAKKYEAKKFDNVIQLNEELKNDIEEKDQIIKELKDSLNQSSKKRNNSKSSQTNLEKESILKKIEQAKNDLLEIGVNTKQIGKDANNTKAVQSRIEIILNEIESYITNNELVQLQNSSSNTEYDRLVSSIAQTICPEDDKTSKTTQTKISSIISNLSLKIQQQKDEISIMQPSSNKAKSSSSNNNNNDDENENLRKQKMRTVDTLENILHQIESAKVDDPSNDQQLMDAISKLKLVGQQIEGSELKYIFNTSNPKLFTEEQYKTLLKKIEDQINSMLKTLAKTANISPPEDIILKKDTSYSDHKEFDLELDGNAYILNVNKSFVKICALIKKQFSISSTNQNHFTKNEAKLKRQIQELEAINEKITEKRKNDSQEIENLTQTNKKLSKRLSKLQNSYTEAANFLFAFQPSVKNKVEEDAPLVEIIRIFINEYGKHVCKHAGKTFVNKLNMIKKSQDTILTAFSKLARKVKNLEDNYAKLAYPQSPSRSVQKKSKK